MYGLYSRAAYDGARTVIKMVRQDFYDAGEKRFIFCLGPRYIERIMIKI